MAEADTGAAQAAAPAADTAPVAPATETPAAEAPATAASLVGGEAPAAPTPAANIADRDAAAAPATGDTPWYQGADEQYLGKIENKGWQSINDILKAHSNAESIRGVPADELVRIPSPEDADGISALYDTLGRPAEAGAYEIEGLEGADADWFKQTAHELGLNNQQANDLFSKHNTQVETLEAKALEQYQMDANAIMKQLQFEWAGAATENMEVARRGAVEMGLTAETAVVLERAIGTKAYMDLTLKAGQLTGEANFIGDGRGQNSGDAALTVAGAKERYTELTHSQEWRDRSLSKDINIRKQALKEQTQLSAIAFPENG